MMDPTSERIEQFLNGSTFAVVGASQDRSKYGNKVFRSYKQAQRGVYAVNPRAQEIEGEKAYPNLKSLPGPIHGVSVIVPPSVTIQVLEEAAELAIEHLWLQPGSESEEVFERAAELGLELIAGGPCILVALGYRGT
jgi:predicted CoA-binding protein